MAGQLLKRSGSPGMPGHQPGLGIGSVARSSTKLWGRGLQFPVACREGNGMEWIVLRNTPSHCLTSMLNVDC